MFPRHAFRKIMTAVLVIVFLLPIFGYSKAGAVDTETARTVAENFLKFINSSKQILVIDEISDNAVDPESEKVTAAFLCRLIDGGYILIAAAQVLTPIKSYSLKGDFDTLPPSVREYLLLETEYNIRTLPALKLSPQAVVTTENQKRWDFLLHPENYRTALEYTPNTFLLTTTWDQSPLYNKFLPEVGGEKVLVGCVNVAMGQLMKYHQHPKAAVGVATHTWNGQLLKAILHHPLYWDLMPDSLNATTPEHQVDAVARLMVDLGVANHTLFGVDGSGAAINLGAMIENYGYARTIASVDNSDLDLFYGTIRSEIDAMRPVLIHFLDHVGVADGYNSDPSGRWIHVNFGWGGHDDDYYFLDESVAAGNYIFSPDLEIDYGIQPCSEVDCAENLEAQDILTDSAVDARFDYGLDADRYDVYLSGDTTISGSIPGFSGQPFYLSLFDSDHNLIDSNNGPLTFVELPAGRYILKASLHGEDLSYYSLIEGHEDYTVTITTTVLSEQEKAAIDSGLDRAPIILNEFENRVAVSGDPQPILLFVDARDQNNDPVFISAISTGSEVVLADYADGILSLTPGAGAEGSAARISVTASAGGKSAEASFIVLVTGEIVGFGKQFEVSGLFEGQSDFNTHKVVLDGSCIITGYNGYANQAFYSSVLDENMQVIVSAGDATIDETFPQGVYHIGASLEENPGGTGFRYSYDPPNNDSYSLAVSCPDADDSIETIAIILGVDLSGTDYLAGDIDNSGVINLIDAILAMKILTGLQDRPEPPYTANEMSQDDRVGLAEAVYIMQKVAGVR